MSKQIWLSLTLILALTACADPDTAAPAPSAAFPTPSAAPASPANPPAVVTRAAITGVSDCDSFLAAYELCVSSKVPVEARAALSTGLEQWKSAWRQLAENPAMQSSLPQICQQARESSRPALSTYGCSL